MARAFRFPVWLICLALLLAAHAASAAPQRAGVDGDGRAPAVTHDLTALAGGQLVAPSPDTSDDDAAAQSSVALEFQARPGIGRTPTLVRAFAAESVILASSVPSTRGPRPPPFVR